MAEKGTSEAIGLIMREVGAALAQVAQDQVGDLERALLGARAVFVVGEGRSGLVARSFAMRLMHLGLLAQVVGETTTPAVPEGALLLAVSASGETATTCALAASARAQGVRVAAVTASPGSSLAAAAHHLVVIPAAGGQGGPAASKQFGGSLFEQSALILLDAVALDLQRRLGRSGAEMKARHATLE